MVRRDSFRNGPEVMARMRVTVLCDKKRVAQNGGPPITAAQETMFRFLPSCILLLRARVPAKK